MWFVCLPVNKAASWQRLKEAEAGEENLLEEKAMDGGRVDSNFGGSETNDLSLGQPRRGCGGVSERAGNKKQPGDVQYV